MEKEFMTAKTSTTQPKTLWVSLFGILCAVAIVLVLLITAVEAVAYWTPGYYEAEYTKYQVLDRLPPMTMEDLLEVTDEMMAYLRGNREDLHVWTTMGGVECEFFNAREIAHMEDVRDLFIGGLWIRRIGLLYAACYALALWAWSRGDTSKTRALKTVVPRALCIGTGIFFAAALVIAGIIATDFSKYFIVFHHIFFDNDLWILNPATDMLINIVPEPFFMDTALRIGITFVAMMAAFLGLCLYLWKRNKR